MNKQYIPTNWAMVFKGLKHKSSLIVDSIEDVSTLNGDSLSHSLVDVPLQLT